MNERRDDTTKPAGESRPARAPGGYYYDDATGYETYSPEDEEEGAEGESPSGGEESDRVARRDEDGGGKPPFPTCQPAGVNFYRSAPAS